MVDFKRSIDISYRRPFYARTRFLFFALLLISIYSYGWRVTEIELGELVRDAHLVKPLIRDLLHPDLFAFETETESAHAFFIFSGRQLSLGKIKKDAQGPVLTLSTNSGQIGNTIGVSGKGGFWTAVRTYGLWGAIVLAIYMIWRRRKAAMMLNN